MKKISVHNKVLLSATLLTLVVMTTSCVNEKEKVSVKFNASVENLASDTKTSFVNERWIYWDLDDEIDAMSDADNEMGMATLVDMNNQHVDTGDYDPDKFNGVFIGSFAWDAKYFLGLYPHNDGNSITASSGNAKGFSATLTLPAEQAYKDDNSFATNQFPMVAWYGGTWSEDPYTPFNLDFHSLAGIVRLQFFTSSATRTITSIEVESDKQISGAFTVKDYNTYNPYLQSNLQSADDKKVTINCDGGVALGSEVKSFYLIIPALAGENAATLHTLNIKVSDGSENANMTLKVNVRRNGITYVQAVDLNNWTAPSAGLVGNGTEAKPFKIYTKEDMEYLRNCFSTTGDVKVNGQTVTENTIFRIMRSDIALPDDWAGIDNFKGKLYYYAEGGTNTMPGITNNSGKPIFNSISADGTVEGLVVRTYGNITPASGTTAYSPFCATNAGTIKDCRISDTTQSKQHTPIVIASSVDFAGICVTNSGTIDGCGNSADMTVNGNVAGVCYTNNGTIAGCYAASPMKVRNSKDNAQVGGIVHTNSSTVQDCYFAARMVNSTLNWGGIVYTNAGTVKRCYAGRNTFVQITPNIETERTVGGIVNNQSADAAKIDYCWTDASLQGNCVGGIIAYLQGGTVVNCFCDAPSMVITAKGNDSYAGGLVANFSKGNLQNSYANISRVYLQSSTGYAGGVVGKVTGTSGAAWVLNCYCYESYTSANHLFYGSNSSTSTGTNHFQRCYVVNASTGVGTEINVDCTPTLSDASTMSTLLTKLQAAAPNSITGWNTWANGTDNLPKLNAPSN